MNAHHPESISCPQCQATVPVHRGYVSWCDHCEWNTDPTPLNEFPTFLDNINQRFGERYGAQLFRAVVEGASSLRPGFSLSRLVAYALALVVHSLTLLLLVGGILLLIFGRPNIVAIPVGILALGIAWAVRPRLGAPPDGVLPRDRYPELYAFVGRVAENLGLKRLDGIVVDHEFNATFQRVGFRGRTYVTIGLPLVSILSREEWVALIGHEIGHGVNGDIQRSVFVGAAVKTLQDWDYFLRPHSLLSSESGVPGVLMLPVNLVLYALSTVTRWGILALAFLLYRDSQRAEYLADQIATKAAGSDAVLLLLEKFNLAEFYDLVLQKTALNKGLNLYTELRNGIAMIPERERERIRRKSRRSDSSVDATHPATAYRIAFIERHGFSAQRNLLSEWEQENILRELSEAFADIQRVAIDAYRSRLYAS